MKNVLDHHSNQKPYNLVHFFKLLRAERKHEFRRALILLRVAMFPIRNDGNGLVTFRTIVLQGIHKCLFSAEVIDFVHCFRFHQLNGIKFRDMDTRAVPVSDHPIIQFRKAQGQYEANFINNVFTKGIQWLEIN